MPRNPSPPDWREFDELEGLVVQRKFRGVGAWSDQNRKTTAQGNNNVQNYLWVKERNLQSDRDKLLNRQWEFHMPPRPITLEPDPIESEKEREYSENNNEFVRVNMVAAEGDYYDSEDDQECQHKRHEKLIGRMTTISTPSPRRTHEDRLISGMKLHYRQKGKGPDGLTGTTGMRILCE